MDLEVFLKKYAKSQSFFVGFPVGIENVDCLKQKCKVVKNRTGVKS